MCPKKILCCRSRCESCYAPARPALRGRRSASRASRDVGQILNKTPQLCCVDWADLDIRNPHCHAGHSTVDRIQFFLMSVKVSFPASSRSITVG